MTDADRTWTWQEIAADLRRQIEDGEYQDGDRLSTRRELMATYRVADRTVDRATRDLREQGWLVARSTAGGWIVRRPRGVIRSTRNRLSRAEREAGRGTFSSDCHAAGLTPNVSTTIDFGPAGDDLGAVLGIDPNDEVCIRDRVMRGDDEVLQLARSALPRALTRNTVLERADSGPGGIYARLEEAGHPLDGFTERVVIGSADEQEARLLALSPGAHVFRVRRIAWSGDVPLEVNDIVLVGDRFELVYELPGT